MVGRGLRNAAAARTPPRLLATASRLAHGETLPQRWLSRLPGQLTARAPQQVRSFSALATIELNRTTARVALDRAGVAYDAPEPAAMHRAAVLVAPGQAEPARAALTAPLGPGVRVDEHRAGLLLVYAEQVAGDVRLAGAELGCEVHLTGERLAQGAVIDFPVDAVYTWVDGSDPRWRDRLRTSWAATHDVSLHPLAANPARFASRDELRFSLRSLEMYAGWVRHVFLVTDQQVPRWLRTDHPGLTVVDHREIFPADGTGLPTFNSHAIEARLHHIPGLADHYLYLNDDVFFGRPVPPELFFATDGSTRFFRTPSTLSDEPASAQDRPVDAAAKVSRELVAREFGRDLSWKYQHVAHPQRRDVLTDLEVRYSDELARTVRSPFRSPDDVSAAASLAHSFGFVTGRAVAGELSYLYCDIGERRAPIKLTRLARRRDADMFCLNDVGEDRRVGHDPERLLRDFLSAYFPLRSGFEVERLMVFTSTIFLFAFLPLAVLAFYAAPARWRAAPLLVMSAVFYAWGEPVLVVLILLTALFTFTWGRLLAEAQSRRARQLLLVSGIVVDLVPIAIFKYLDFALTNLGLGDVARRTHLPLPIGVSFYTFMAVGYLIDIYRRRDAGAPRLLAFSGFLTMFPHLVAGPIVRWYDIGPQLAAPRFDPGLFGYGALRVASGLAKKAVLADSLAVEVDRLFATGAPTSTGAAWVAALLYSLQIYLDFSAYSDIAIGIAAMLGVRFHENFRFPYVAKSAREFWQRWHISLGSWFRDYLYIPLGGSRVRPMTLWRNLLIVWGVTGLWHGAAWTFVLWGLYYGVVIALERSMYGDALARLPGPVQHLYALLVALVGWVIFRSTSLHQVGEYYRAMVGAGVHAGGWDISTSYSVQQTWVIVVIGVLLAAGVARPLMDRVELALAGVYEGQGVAAPLDTATEASASVVTSRQQEHRVGPAGPSPAAARTATAVMTATLAEVAASSVEEAEDRTDGAGRDDGAGPAARAGLALAAAVIVAVLLFAATAFVVAVNYTPFIYFRF